MADGYSTSRNFRSAYYEKLGFCGNDEKNCLDLLIASSPFDVEKLSELCERFDLDRSCIEAWKVLLGVECNRKNPFDEYANVRRVRAEHFQSLRHHLEVLLRFNLVIRDRGKKCSKQGSKPMDSHNHLNEDSDNQSHINEQSNSNVPERELIDSKNQVRKPVESNESSENSGADVAATITKKKPGNDDSTSINLLEEIKANPSRQITLMYLLEVGRLDSSDIGSHLNSTYCRKLSAMASFFLNVSSDLQEAFFLFRNFIKELEENDAFSEAPCQKVHSNKL